MAKAKKEYTHLEMEAALCVWECLNEWTLLAGSDRVHDEVINDEEGNVHADWIELRKGVGSVEMRHQSIVLGKWCLKVYDFCTKHNPEFFAGVAYDWEVIPMILEEAYHNGVPAIYAEFLPAPEKVALIVAHRHLYSEFYSDCRHQAQKQWAYGDLVDDNPPDIERAFASGEEPAAFIKALGEDLDLIDFGPWTTGISEITHAATKQKPRL